MGFGGGSSYTPPPAPPPPPPAATPPVMANPNVTQSGINQRSRAGAIGAAGGTIRNEGGAQGVSEQSAALRSLLG